MRRRKLTAAQAWLLTELQDGGKLVRGGRPTGWEVLMPWGAEPVWGRTVWAVVRRGWLEMDLYGWRLSRLGKLVAVGARGQLGQTVPADGLPYDAATATGMYDRGDVAE